MTNRIKFNFSNIGQPIESKTGWSDGQMEQGNNNIPELSVESAGIKINIFNDYHGMFKFFNFFFYFASVKCIFFFIIIFVLQKQKI